MTYSQAKWHQHFYMQTLDQPSRLLSELPWTNLSKWKSIMNFSFFFFFYHSCRSSLMTFTIKFYHSSQVHTKKKQQQATNSKRDRQTCIQCKQNTDAGCCFLAGTGDLRHWWRAQSPATKRNCAVKFASLALIGAARSDSFEKGKCNWYLDVQSAKSTTSPTMIP